ncbi:MAG TPA: DUF3467 domain-containing protein [Candidatus Sulfopaludibacter sp.]|jgi:hypothetical protein|nr:DUF3467 domain-containing protein [Candidatus Sulfopaludibacter sp.]
MANEQDDEQFEEAVPMYANNVRFEMTAWDLRIFFGQLVAGGAAEIDYHTDVTIPWSQAKLMHLYLGVNIMLYERDNGRITIPKSVLPSPLTSPPEGVDASTPESIEAFRMVQEKIRAFREKEKGGQA